MYGYARTNLKQHPPEQHGCRRPAGQMRNLYQENIMTDREIIGCYWNRSETAITATAEKYGNYCHTIAYNILHNHEDAEECVNDTYLLAWRSIPPERPIQLSAYLGKITRNLSLNRFKQYHAQKRGTGQVPLVLSELEDCIPAGSNVEQAMEEMFLVNSIERFLQGQSRDKRNIFIRRYFLLSPLEEIASSYGMSRSKIKSLLFRMRKNLKKHLEKDGIL